MLYGRYGMLLAHLLSSLLDVIGTAVPLLAAGSLHDDESEELLVGSNLPWHEISCFSALWACLVHLKISIFRV